jgi:hypothetical protein
MEPSPRFFVRSSRVCGLGLGRSHMTAPVAQLSFAQKAAARQSRNQTRPRPRNSLMSQEALDRSETIPERNDRQCTAPRSVEYEFEDEDEHEIAHRTVFRNCEPVCSSSSKEKILAKKQDSQLLQYKGH